LTDASRAAGTDPARDAEPLINREAALGPATFGDETAGESAATLSLSSFNVATDDSAFRFAFLDGFATF